MRKLMSAVTVLAIVAISNPADAAAVVLAKWVFPTPASAMNDVPAQMPYVANVAPGLISRGPGLVGVSTSAAINASGWTSGTSIDPDDYYSITIAPSAGHTLDLDDLRYGESRSGTGPATIEVRSSLDNYSSVLKQYASNNQTSDITVSLGSAFDAVASSVTFRVYGYGSTASGGTYRISNGTANLGGVLFDGAVGVLNSAPTILATAVPTVAFGTVVTSGVNFSTTITAKDTDTADILKLAFDNPPAGVTNLVVTGGGSGTATFTVTGTLDYSLNGTNVNLPYTVSDGHTVTPGILTLQVVPEPTTICALAATAAVAVRRRR